MTALCVSISPDWRSCAGVLCRYVAVVTVLNLVVASFIDGFSNLYEDPEEQDSQSDHEIDMEGAVIEGKNAEGAKYESKTEYIESESKSREDVDPEGEVLSPGDPEGADSNGLHAGTRSLRCVRIYSHPGVSSGHKFPHPPVVPEVIFINTHKMRCSNITENI